jgi:hypothetical protein
LHIGNIYKEGELAEPTTVKDFLTVQKEGSRRVKRALQHYSPDVIISVGYRIKSHVATRFRIWATNVIKEYMIKGFALDDERLKEARNNYSFLVNLVNPVNPVNPVKLLSMCYFTQFSALLPP